eukprot:TRINITY_DN26421_c0_g1_i1.p1 TRINITY_DN26421_c0_g1~~TRINITY_DN26421_c0_g1_i1.p1  ORF type:complete len:260 (-),score=43.69 TRINITY_DN26421_c0_g1_i1:259-1038(-)
MILVMGKNKEVKKGNINIIYYLFVNRNKEMSYFQMLNQKKYLKERSSKQPNTIKIYQRADISPSKVEKKVLQVSGDNLTMCVKVSPKSLSPTYSKAQKNLIDQFYRSKNPFYQDSKKFNFQEKKTINQQISQRLYKVPTLSTLQKLPKLQTRTLKCNPNTLSLSNIQTSRNQLTDLKGNSFYNNEVIEEIIREKDSILKNQLLVENILKMKQMQLLKKYNINGQDFAKNINLKFIYNDYHSRHTNNGFVRNTLGNFFTK